MAAQFEQWAGLVMNQLIPIAVGGAIGSVLRFLIASSINQRAQGASSVPIFPFGTLLVNSIGCFLIGLFFIVLQQRFTHHSNFDLLRGLIMIGILGGFTTFSTFSLETLQLMQVGLWGKALLNIIASVGVCIFAAMAGIGIGRVLA